MPPPSAPLLPSFRIQGFRAFRDLEIPRLGRVNLIVGKNNVGKTTLLEAIKVYAAGIEAAYELRELLVRRQEVQRVTSREERFQSVNISRAFFQPATAPSSSLHLGPIIQGKRLSLRLGRRAFLKDDSGRISRSQFIPLDEQDQQSLEGTEEALQIRLGIEVTRHVRLDEFVSLRGISFRRPGQSEPAGLFTCQYIPARGISSPDIGPYWDSIVLTEGEQSALQALRIIAPDIERISLVEGPMVQGMRYALVARKGHTAPEPLYSMGDGMNRIFELALGLVNSKSGLFLVDEVENGVHYSAQEQLWRFIFEAASQLGVQVFATTHSWDCIAAFQKAASSHPEDGMLISLAQTDGDIKATVFNEGDLEIITRESIEVR
ncbi:AAA family ATPase [Corallococcus carmarthensis]|uniref:ATP-binding protein n=1 Tax=Corallococcus carmarthensis TaxID=2316728 RepID=A0A3A8JP05_9BACT|nr:ATP-binding protein [Corallococcus carmarthensis]NOK20621.1 ATP-binding protein [Corallococcus carmarthensis]RKG96748.1 ATP-binding protein [Corallococcus carmarthensis]